MTQVSQSPMFNEIKLPGNSAARHRGATALRSTGRILAGVTHSARSRPQIGVIQTAQFKMTLMAITASGFPIESFRPGGLKRAIGFVKAAPTSRAANPRLRGGIAALISKTVWRDHSDSACPIR